MLTQLLTLTPTHKFPSLVVPLYVLQQRCRIRKLFRTPGAAVVKRAQERLLPGVRCHVVVQALSGVETYEL